MKKKVICINDSDFNFIKKGQEYDVEKETRDYIYIKNDSGLLKRYGRNRFEDIEMKEATPKTVVKKRPEKKEETVAVCVFPREGLSFGTSYKFKPSSNESKIIITDDKGVESEHLKKRFDFK